MRILSRLGDLVSSVVCRSCSTLDAIVESIASLFAGDRATRRNVAFGVALIALSAKMAKADGIVAPSEVAAFRQILQIPPEEMRNVFRLYDLAKQDTAGFEAYAAKMRGLCEDGEAECALLGDVLDGLFHIAKADGLVHERELSLLAEIATIFGLSEATFERTRLRHIGGPGNPYLVLGLEASASPSETRSRYLSLVRENHPDRLTARGVPDEFMFIATERMKAINAAYESITRQAALA